VDRCAKASTAKSWCSGKVDQVAEGETDTETENYEVDEKRRRRFVLRYYPVFNVEQCELPQSVLDKLPKIETHQHDAIEAAERVITRMPNPPEIEYAGQSILQSDHRSHHPAPTRAFYRLRRAFRDLGA
jgi:hypothetical protein